MRLVNRELLTAFAQAHSDAEAHITAWAGVVKKATWETPHDIKATLPKASLMGKGNVAFDIYRNNYRIWAKVDYKRGVVMVKDIGTHKEYDRWDFK